MRSQLLRIYKDKKSITIFFLIMLMPCIDLMLVKLQWHTDLNPLIAFFLAGESEGHIMQILLFWFLPIYLLILCAESYIQDMKSGYNNILISIMGKYKYFRDKIIISFIVPFVVMGISLSFNLFLASIIYAGGTYGTERGGLLDIGNSTGVLSMFSVSHPFLIDILFLLNVSLFAGLAGIFSLGITIILPNRKYAYPLAYFIWFILVSLPGHSVTLLMQPFAEFDFDVMIPTFIIHFLILVIIPIGAYFYKVKTDEL